MNSKERGESLTLKILEAIDERSNVTQRGLARRMNVALGLANSYIKRCVRKGWVKINQAPANRYAYYLTPTGFAEKSRLTAQYLSASFSFYRKAGDSCRGSFLECQKRQWSRVVLCGVSDLAEIAALRALEHGIKVVGAYDPETESKNFLNRRVARSIAECEPYDACLLTDLRNPQQGLDRLLTMVPRERIIVPTILGLK